MAAETMLTPRDLHGEVTTQVPRGRVLPYGFNPRTGWKEALHGQPDPRVDAEMNKESVLVNSLLRDHSGFKRRELNSYQEWLDDDDDDFNDEMEGKGADSGSGDGFGHSDHIRFAEGSSGEVESGVDGGLPPRHEGGLIEQGVSATTGSSSRQVGFVDLPPLEPESEEEEFSMSTQGQNQGQSHNEDQSQLARGLQKKSIQSDSAPVLESKSAESFASAPSHASDGSSFVSKGNEEGVGLEALTEQLDEQNNHNGQHKHTHRHPRDKQAQSLERQKQQKQQKQALTAQEESAAREEDRGAVVLDGREVFDKIGVPNSRQLHNLLLRSAYEGYSVGGEPMVTASFPREKNKLGTDCMDYIFYSSGLLMCTRLLSIPELPLLREGENPQDICATEDVNYLRPFYCAAAAFDTPLRTFFKNMRASSYDEDDLLSSTDDPKLVKHISRGTVESAKRYLKEKLKKSHVAGNRAGAAQVGGRVESDLWGGKWPMFPRPNHQRRNFFLPNDKFASSHIALAAELELNVDLVTIQWDYK